MFDDMVEVYQLNIAPEEVTLVRTLIAGDRKRPSLFQIVDADDNDRLGETTSFLFEIVAMALASLLASGDMRYARFTDVYHEVSLVF